jgi:hypothetical protein
MAAAAVLYQQVFSEFDMIGLLQLKSDPVVGIDMGVKLNLPSEIRRLESRSDADTEDTAEHVVNARIGLRL